MEIHVLRADLASLRAPAKTRRIWAASGAHFTG